MILQKKKKNHSESMTNFPSILRPFYQPDNSVLLVIAKDEPTRRVREKNHSSAKQRSKNTSAQEDVAPLAIMGENESSEVTNYHSLHHRSNLLIKP
jgi:hypothetical protein